MKRTDDLFSSILKLLKGRTRVTTKIHETAERDQSRPELVYPMNEYWDYLIILDACRYDYFEKVYSDYFPRGKLTKRLSPGTWTLEWASKVFRDTYQDCVYVSANPFIGNSNDIRHKNLTNFRAGDHFYKIFDVWKTHWDNNLGTVPPEAVNEVALEAVKSYPNKRIIVHYMQPHYPYLGLDGIAKRRADVALLCGYIRGGMVRAFGDDIGNKLGAKLAPNHEEWIAKKCGISQLKGAYENNLRAVMTSVASLLACLKGKAVITADHGELLGEQDKFGHPVRFRGLAQQSEVPWLEVGLISRIISEFSSNKAPSEYLDNDNEVILNERLKALGYE